ncbi:glycosyl hydrolase family 10 [Trichoderma arundinaceum]|uniref:Glycosyl hydrolase family 10 n=1 Tax=Trichoderma arundinaceum TaxID=490622 RepID=A0A395NS32_TRIAR|nr:glycosyl hydrolase family 10 [Trichoderma arundinaceum]
MRVKLILYFMVPFVATLPAQFIQLDSELAARRINITERLASFEERQASLSIDQLFKNRGKVYFGTATDRGLLQRERNAAIIQANFGQVTPENSMKWQTLNPNQGQYNWVDADYLVNFAQQNGKTIRGHTLIWHSQLPGWVNSITNADVLRQVIRNHVLTVVGRYRGKIRAWVS